MPTVPRPKPCSSCPYRRDVPSGVWAEQEYDKLPGYDGTTGEQAEAGMFGVFMCHQADGYICAGWAGCHDMQHNLALRMASLMDPDIDVKAVRDYVCPVPLWGSGAEAAEHGKRDIGSPTRQAGALADKLRAMQERKAKRWNS